MDILSVALESGGFTDENLIDQLMTFLAAGHETTASAMTWAAYLLAKHPEVQTRLRAEIRENLPSISDTDTTVSSVDIDRLPYLTAVCNEVLRYLSKQQSESFRPLYGCLGSHCASETASLLPNTSRNTPKRNITADIVGRSRAPDSPRSCM